MNVQIIGAIKNSKIIKFEYEGELRIVEPHCYGLAKNGEAIRAYQIDGYSSVGKLGWKLYSVSKISKLEILEDNFKAREAERYKKGDTAMSVIYIEM